MVLSFLLADGCSIRGRGGSGVPQSGRTLLELKERLLAPGLMNGCVGADFSGCGSSSFDLVLRH